MEYLTGNIQILKQQSRTHLTAIATLQAYNALNIVELFRYLDSIGVDFYAYPVSHPAYLSPIVLPPAARRSAAERLRSYAAADCLPKNRELILGLAKSLDKVDAPEPFDEQLMRSFMLFTNDLDITRGQSFQDTHQELLQLIIDAGFPWTDETFHASRIPTNGPSFSSPCTIRRFLSPPNARPQIQIVRLLELIAETQPQPPPGLRDC